MGASSDDALADELVSACRTTIGDSMRSITYFTVEDYEQVYIRSDLERDAELDRFVANERLGFTSQQTYGDSELGAYEFTIRAFDRGYVTRVIVGDRGVYVTTDKIHMDEFEELATAVRGVLREHRSD
ncbi:hypothetical protein SAMN06269185_1040 [Natronoarchaeum philippinense]|uniref:Uncharacterized protein n=1 Tax=Natronoarchaeum philippinense TaxID=558529 RepID=A0A285N9A4_NATPI|nr:hypothetical protein [Natronoarchaeum philippinense]SNZ06084.1 hypothetical protein SAMN06269185_1040 [Natronoarchaeum philippinense]